MSASLAWNTVAAFTLYLCIKVGMAFGSAGITYPLAVGDCDPIICARYYLVHDIGDEVEAAIDSRHSGVKLR